MEDKKDTRINEWEIRRVVDTHGVVTVYLPKKMAKTLGIEIGSQVKVTLNEESKQLIIERINNGQHSD